MSSESAAVATHSIIYLGMDVHKESITIAVLPAGEKAPTRLDRLPNDLPKLKKWLDRVARDGELRICYEASGAGYVLHRAIREWGYACEVIAPSLIPKRPGVQRKHDKRDASDLARLYRAGELTAVRIPSESDERVRDVVRWSRSPCDAGQPARETFQREILSSFSSRATTSSSSSRGADLSSARERTGAPLVHTASHLGLVSREDSSGNRTRLGSITKAGNSHCRHVLVQAAWSYRHRPQTSVDLEHRQQGQPPSVIGHVWKAQ